MNILYCCVRVCLFRFTEKCLLGKAKVSWQAVVCILEHLKQSRGQKIISSESVVLIALRFDMLVPKDDISQICRNHDEIRMYVF